MNIASIVAAFSFASTGATIEPVGVWRIADGTANVAIHACGTNLCGHVSWTKDSNALIGQPVLIGMKKTGNVWSGTIVNARDGQKYDARIQLQNEQVLKVEGCVSGGVICGGQQWSRLK